MRLKTFVASRVILAHKVTLEIKEYILRKPIEQEYKESLTSLYVSQGIDTWQMAIFNEF